MNVNAWIFLILGLLLVGLGLFALIHYGHPFLKNRMMIRLEKKEIYTIFASTLAIGLGCASLFGALFLANPAWKEQTTHVSGVFTGEPIYYGGDVALSLIGSFLFGTGFAWFFYALRVILRKEKMEQTQRKLFLWTMFAALACGLAGLWMMTQGVADFITYPLVSGFVIGEKGFEWTHAGYRPSGFSIAFYALCILTGALICYFVSDERMARRYHKHGMLEIVFVICFPCGILGARLWYVVGNWAREFQGREFYHVFEIWNGGLTILGGAFFGAVAGLLALRHFQKNVDARWAMGEIVPTILIGQAAGRWGNFFNVEVYGRVTSVEGWRWLPTWILEQMNHSNDGTALAAGQIHVPLFFIESCLSIVGYFLIQYAFGVGLKKHMARGDKAGLYFSWYGIVRIIMEPFRDVTFNMGADNSWSISNSLVYILIGLSLIGIFHLHDAYEAKRNGGRFSWIAALLLLPAFFFPFLPSVTTSSARDGEGNITSYTGYGLFGQGQMPLFIAALALAGLAFLLFGIAFFFRKNEKIYDKLMLAGAIASALAACGWLFGKSVNSFDSSLYVNLSYGTVLDLCFALMATCVGFLYLRDKRKFLKGAQ